MKKLYTALFLFLLVFLAACSDAEPQVAEETPAPSPTPAPIVTPEPEPEPEFPYTHPLTGVGMDEDISGGRPFVFVINNLNLALPQHGLRHADIIYEVPVEGGITRLLAVMQDIYGVGEVGPIRSARNYMLDIVQAHDGILVHAGGSPQAYEQIRGRPVPNVDGVLGSGREFFRDSERSRRFGSEHALFTSDELLLQYIDLYSYRREHNESFHPGFSFLADATPRNGDPATDVEIALTSHMTNRFVFDEESNLYYVNQYGQAHIDGVTGEQLAVTNVLVVFASFTVVDNEGRLAVDFNLGGQGYFISGGYATPVVWRKGGNAAPFLFDHLDGRPLQLSAGRTYVNIVNSNTGSVTFGS